MDIIRGSLVLSVCAVCLVSPASAVEWTHLGASEFTMPDPGGRLRDWSRIRLFDAVVDPQGNIYFTAGDCENNDANHASGITILQKSGDTYNVINVDLSPATFSGLGRVDLEVPGGITKMVVGGDGKVYALQNWLEINWDYARGWDHKILRINSDGSVDVIFNATAEGHGDRELDKIRGMTVGGDGHVYWTMNGDDEVDCPNTCWASNMLYRYNVTAQAVQPSPLNGTYDAGWGQAHRLVDLEYVEDGWFAVIGGEGGPDYGADAIGWDNGRTRRVAVNGSRNPGWGANRVTHTAYDPVNNVLWMAPRGKWSGYPDPTGVTTIMFRWRGDAVNEGLFTGDNDPVAGILFGDLWHANGNDPRAGDNAYPNSANYWVTAMAVSPCHENALWLAYGGEAGYDEAGLEANGCGGGGCEHAALGPIHVVPRDSFAATQTEGDPHEVLGTGNDSQTVALTFAGGKVYAVTADLTTGEFNLFSADNPGCQPSACCMNNVAGNQCIDLTEGECLAAGGVWLGVGTNCEENAGACPSQVCHDPFADADGDLDVDQDDFGLLQACVTGIDPDNAPGVYPPQKCACFDRNGDDDIAGVDIGAFENCASGPDLPADPACDD